MWPWGAGCGGDSHRGVRHPIRAVVSQGEPHGPRCVLHAGSWRPAVGVNTASRQSKGPRITLRTQPHRSWILRLQTNHSSLISHTYSRTHSRSRGGGMPRRPSSSTLRRRPLGHLHAHRGATSGATEEAQGFRELVLGVLRIIHLYLFSAATLVPILGTAYLGLVAAVLDFLRSLVCPLPMPVVSSAGGGGGAGSRPRSVCRPRSRGVQGIPPRMNGLWVIPQPPRMGLVKLGITLRGSTKKKKNAPSRGQGASPKTVALTVRWGSMSQTRINTTTYDTGANAAG